MFNFYNLPALFFSTDVCIPALFMPLSSSRPLIFNPRAHNYFHPPGSYDNRVSQPPAIFKLPPLQTGVSLIAKAKTIA